MGTFLLGYIVATSLAAAMFFFKFWQRSHDRLFLAFGLSFLIEAGNRLRFMLLDNPAEGSPSIYAVRALAFLLIVLAIILKNREQPQ